MKYKLGCDLDYQVDSFSTFIFNFRIAQIDCQKIISEHLQLDPDVHIDEFAAPVLENRYFRVNVSPGTNLRVSYRAEVEMSHFYGDPNQIMEIQPAELPKATWPYLYPSRFCQSDRLVNLALSEFGGELMGYSRVTAICNWIFDKVYYQYGTSSSHTSAFDTATERIGVCRDFAHLGIAFCRALNIPARFVSSYAYGLTIPDFHACFEAYLGNRWYLFDATRLAPQNGIVRIGTGRDAADVSIATIFGNVSMNDMRIFIEHIPDLDCPGIPEPTTEAIAIL
ncbi:transglutaminase-like domain-containing protein [Methylotuvimicrobium buryatense]|uniref:Transglutaminase family protein n=1 Tax=Methylotuvimicrobium buryatense TaxID=95641 RepID=A0A4P9ULE4_METBY|nr:transglutaminase family protein [Methylotuvimicrobium buryatense]QCW82082.1 transglutaminase family protein [Methylotuvimicrobium buryatense]